MSISESKRCGKFLFVSGYRGSGKTSLGERLKRDHNFLHFNADVWVFGGDPILESGEIPDVAMMARRDPALNEIFDTMMEKGYGALASGAAAPLDVWVPFHSRLCAAIRKIREDNIARDLVVSFSVHMASVREYIREQLGSSLLFVILYPSVDQVGRRRYEHLKETAALKKMTLAQTLHLFRGPHASPEADLSEDVLLQILTDHARDDMKLYERPQSSEKNTLEVGDGGVAEVDKQVQEFMNDYWSDAYRY